MMKKFLLILILLSLTSIHGKTLTFNLNKTFDFNLDLNESCLLDGKVSNSTNVYEVITNKSCSSLNFKEGQKITCKMKNVIRKKENNVTTFSGRGDCK